MNLTGFPKSGDMFIFHKISYTVVNFRIKENGDARYIVVHTEDLEYPSRSEYELSKSEADNYVKNHRRSS